MGARHQTAHDGYRGRLTVGCWHIAADLGTPTPALPLCRGEGEQSCPNLLDRAPNARDLPVHIGLIGGTGPGATRYYYRGLVDAHAAYTADMSDPPPMDLTIVQAEAHDMARNFAAKRPADQAAIFARLIGRLAGAGATMAALTSLGAHFCLDELRPISPLPLLDATPVLDAGLAARGLKRVGLLGSSVVMATKVYGGLHAVEAVAPTGDALEAVHADSVAMAVAGAATDDQRNRLFRAGRSLCADQGAEVVVLASTDLFLAFEGQDCGFPVINSTDIHIAAIHAQMMADRA